MFSAPIKHGEVVRAVVQAMPHEEAVPSLKHQFDRDFARDFADRFVEVRPAVDSNADDGLAHQLTNGIA